MGLVGDGAARSMLMGRAAGVGGLGGERVRTGRQGREGGGRRTGRLERQDGWRNSVEQVCWVGVGIGAGLGGWLGGG